MNDVLFNKFKYEAEVDFLTGLKNVRTFNHVIENLDEYFDKRFSKISAIFMDIDYFKRINDTYGHETGDNILREIGEIFRNSFRSFDLLFRIGGEEFVAILPGCNHAQAMEIGERVRKKFEEYGFKVDERHEIKLTISIGVSTYPETINDLNQIIRQADKALYKAKETGRNKVETYSVLE